MNHAGVMRFCDNITARVLVWLSAILVPVETAPSAACNCGSRALCSAAVRPDRADLASAAKCPHCIRESQPRRTCCNGASGSSAQPGSCCGAAGSCCCKGGSCSRGGLCQCSQHKSVPAPDPLPSGSRTDDAKSLTISANPGLVTVAILIPPAATTCANHQPMSLGSSVPERLSVLCRFLI